MSGAIEVGTEGTNAWEGYYVWEVRESLTDYI